MYAKTHEKRQYMQIFYSHIDNRDLRGEEVQEHGPGLLRKVGTEWVLRRRPVKS